MTRTGTHAHRAHHGRARRVAALGLAAALTASLAAIAAPAMAEDAPAPSPVVVPESGTTPTPAADEYWAVFGRDKMLTISPLANDGDGVTIGRIPTPPEWGSEPGWIEGLGENGVFSDAITFRVFGHGTSTVAYEACDGGQGGCAPSSLTFNVVDQVAAWGANGSIDQRMTNVVNPYRRDHVNERPGHPVTVEILDVDIPAYVNEATVRVVDGNRVEIAAGWNPQGITVPSPPGGPHQSGTNGYDIKFTYRVTDWTGSAEAVYTEHVNSNWDDGFGHGGPGGPEDPEDCTGGEELCGGTTTHGDPTQVICQHDVVQVTTLPAAKDDNVVLKGGTYAGGETTRRTTWAHDPGTKGQACGTTTPDFRAARKSSAALDTLTTMLFGSEAGGSIRMDAIPAGRYGVTVKAREVECSMSARGLIISCDAPRTAGESQRRQTATCEGMRDGWPKVSAGLLDGSACKGDEPKEEPKPKDEPEDRPHPTIEAGATYSVDRPADNGWFAAAVLGLSVLIGGLIGLRGYEERQRRD